MTKQKKKKKNDEPIYLFAWNKNFVGGYTNTPGNNDYIIKAIEDRYPKLLFAASKSQQLYKMLIKEGK